MHALLPDIRVGGKHAILQRLWGHPADWKQTFTTFTIVICLVNVSGHAKVYNQTQDGTVFKDVTMPIQVSRFTLLHRRI